MHVSLPPHVSVGTATPAELRPQQQSADAGSELRTSLKRSAFEIEETLAAQRAEEARITEQANALASSIEQPVTTEMKVAQAASLDRLEALGRVGTHLKNITSAQTRVNELVTSGKVPADHPVVREASQYIFGELLAAQHHAQIAGLSLEAASKIVESGTSGVRTVLQTQT